MKYHSNERIYAAIDLKSFYASVECQERHLDPMTTHLVVADASRTEKTICLAVSPALKAQGVPGRPRLFEVIQRVKNVNAKRLSNAIRSHKAVRGEDGKFTFSNESYDDRVLKCNPSAKLSYIIAPPRMKLYMDYSTKIYSIYLKYVSSEDIIPYSIDEVFIDLTPYLNYFQLSARELAMKMIRDVLKSTGITATCGIGTNLYLAKIAMDIMAKHMPADADGVRIAELDEMTYRRHLWTHEPITDFWRVGKGYARRLSHLGLHTMGDIARCSVGKPEEYYNEELLYQTFGINAELLIDHAWGWEPTTIEQIRNYQPASKCASSGQVLPCPYDAEKARLAVLEMAELQALSLVDKGLVTDQIVLTIGYDRESLNGARGQNYSGPITTDAYGRRIPKHAHGTTHLKRFSNSAKLISEATLKLYDRIMNPSLLVRRLTLDVHHLTREDALHQESDQFFGTYEQLDMFSVCESANRNDTANEIDLQKERKLQCAMLSMQKKYGKNAVLKGMNLLEGATTIDRNGKVGGHKA